MSRYKVKITGHRLFGNPITRTFKFDTAKRFMQDIFRLGNFIDDLIVERAVTVIVVVPREE